MFYRTEPVFVERPWGGSDFRGLFPQCPDGPIGEVWLLSGIKGKSTLITQNGSIEPEARNLSDRTEEMIGSTLPRFPVMIKLLKAKEWLSVQVHPDDRIARIEEGEPWGKSEMWVVVGTDEEALLIDGLKKDFALESLRERSDPEAFARKIETALHFVKPEIGEIYEIPSGTVHALGPGVFVIEIQQTSELTYRLFDWGRQRPVQVEKAVEAVVSDGLRAKKTPLDSRFKQRLFRLLLSIRWNGRRILPFVVAGVPHDRSHSVPALAGHYCSFGRKGPFGRLLSAYRSGPHLAIIHSVRETNAFFSTVT